MCVCVCCRCRRRRRAAVAVCSCSIFIFCKNQSNSASKAGRDNGALWHSEWTIVPMHHQLLFQFFLLCAHYMKSHVHIVLFGLSLSLSVVRSEDEFSKNTPLIFLLLWFHTFLTRKKNKSKQNRDREKDQEKEPKTNKKTKRNMVDKYRKTVCGVCVMVLKFISSFNLQIKYLCEDCTLHKEI